MDGTRWHETLNLLVEGQAVALDSRERVTLGSHPSNHLVIGDPTVSRVHAAIERAGPVHIITDLRSRNGTFVNGERILGHVTLQDGDDIRLGKARLTYRADPLAGTTTEPVESAPDVTDRERHVLVELCRPIATGTVFTEPASATEVSRALFISEAAVRMHLSRLYKKFGISGDRGRRGQLASAALDRGVISVADLRKPAPDRPD